MQHIWPYCFGKYKPLTPICAVFEGLVVSRLPKHHDQSMNCFLAAINYHSLLNWACDHHPLPNYAGTVTDTVLTDYMKAAAAVVSYECVQSVINRKRYFILSFQKYAFTVVLPSHPRLFWRGRI